MSDETKQEESQPFNDAELQDIMSEIENLEQEFGDEVEHPVAESAEPQQENEPEEVVAQQEEEDKDTAFDADELDSISSELDEELEEPCEEPESPVISNFPSRPEAEHSSVSSPVQFEGSGDMNFNLSFDVAGEKAHLYIKDGSLKVSVKGVELTLKEDGCHVHMDGGVTFSVPFEAQDSEKKAA